MIVQFRKWGNSLAVRIPKSVADAISASDGKRVELTVRNGALVLQPLAKPKRKPRYSLDELLASMTRDNVPQEGAWGPPRGNEAWRGGRLLPEFRGYHLARLLAAGWQRTGRTSASARAFAARLQRAYRPLHRVPYNKSRPRLELSCCDTGWSRSKGCRADRPIAQCLLGATRLAICMRSPSRCG